MTMRKGLGQSSWVEVFKLDEESQCDAGEGTAEEGGSAAVLISDLSAKPAQRSRSCCDASRTEIGAERSDDESDEWHRDTQPTSASSSSRSSPQLAVTSGSSSQPACRRFGVGAARDQRPRSRSQSRDVNATSTSGRSSSSSARRNVVGDATAAGDEISQWTTSKRARSAFVDTHVGVIKRFVDGGMMKTSARLEYRLVETHGSSQTSTGGAQLRQQPNHLIYWIRLEFINHDDQSQSSASNVEAQARFVHIDCT
jgi:hypothetical protein